MIRQAVLIASFWLIGAQAATVGETDRFIPLIQDGGGWSTQVTIANLSGKPAAVIAAFVTPKGYNDPWRLDLKAPQGKVTGSTVEASLAPGAIMVIETSGTPAELTRGFADIAELQDLPIGAFARLVKRENGRIVESMSIPFSPAHESRSVVPVDLTDPTASFEMVWVSLTSSTSLALTFRRETGEIAFTGNLESNGDPQFFAKPVEQWPQLAGFRGTMEWKVTFPRADRYEYRVLSSISVSTRGGLGWVATPAMTLKADQLSTSPY